MFNNVQAGIWDTTEISSIGTSSLSSTYTGFYKVKKSRLQIMVTNWLKNIKEQNNALWDHNLNDKINI